MDERSHKDRIKDKRKAMMEERLAKVRQRRNLKEQPAESMFHCCSIILNYCYIYAVQRNFVSKSGNQHCVNETLTT